ncbi:ribosomal protein 60S [Favolaschia claudopus]|uniref:Ribosomal protein 60S n=1 Tax=Favolaschia claudopus TaxID=2862362 RepID=A0AAW0BV91_9AGAR
MVPEPLDLDALDSFPAPPTFIPPSPAGVTFFNPPPSRPPTAPLPPVPGPSRIGDNDLLLLAGRRRSKHSIRDSVASTRSTASTRSSPHTPSSPAQSLLQPSFASLDENPPDDVLLDAKALLDDDSDALEDVYVPIPPMPNRRTSPRTTTPKRESIALTSVAIPVEDPDTEPDFDALDGNPPRTVSPDITTILAATPRPRLAPQRIDEEPWEEDFIDDYGKVRASVRSSSDFTFGYPDVGPPDSLASDDGHHVDEPPESEPESDLDLHTSLPQLMLHHGFLSPHSKLLAASRSLAPSPAASPASSLFPNIDHPPRDTRDTPRRRVRHRDGKTLRGGIGLTTGLGWSDSEDEDAPSDLTRRISSLNLHQPASHLARSRASSLSTRASTFSSVPSGRTSTLASASVRASTVSSSASTSRSTSRVQRRTQSEHEATDTDIDEFGTWTTRRAPASRGAAPPTSWTRRSDPTSRLSRAQSYSTLGRIPSIRTDDSSHSVRTTATTSSAETARTTSSLPLVRTRSRVLRDDLKPLPRTPSLRRNPSTASSASVAHSLPQTRSLIRPRAVTGLGGANPVSGLPQTRMPAPLSMQSTPHPGLPSTDAHVPPVPRTPGSLRPLRLAARQPVLGGDRAPVPVPSVLHTNTTGLPASGTASSLASSVSSSSSFEYNNGTTPLSASTSATSVSTLLTPSSSLNGHLAAPASPIAGGQFAYAQRSPSPYARGPPSPGILPSPTPSPGFGPPAGGFAAAQQQQLQTLKTPTTPMYDQASMGLPRPKPRTGTGMVYRTSSNPNYSVRTSKIGIAL